MNLTNIAFMNIELQEIDISVNHTSQRNCKISTQLNKIEKHLLDLLQKQRSWNQDESYMAYMVTQHLILSVGMYTRHVYDVMR